MTDDRLVKTNDFDCFIGPAGFDIDYSQNNLDNGCLPQQNTTHDLAMDMTGMEAFAPPGLLTPVYPNCLQQNYPPQIQQQNARADSNIASQMQNEQQTNAPNAHVQPQQYPVMFSQQLHQPMNNGGQQHPQHVAWPKTGPQQQQFQQRPPHTPMAARPDLRPQQSQGPDMSQVNQNGFRQPFQPPPQQYHQMMEQQARLQFFPQPPANKPSTSQQQQQQQQMAHFQGQQMGTGMPGFIPQEHPQRPFMLMGQPSSSNRMQFTPPTQTANYPTVNIVGEPERFGGIPQVASIIKLSNPHHDSAVSEEQRWNLMRWNEVQVRRETSNLMAEPEPKKRGRPRKKPVDKDVPSTSMQQPFIAAAPSTSALKVNIPSYPPPQSYQNPSNYYGNFEGQMSTQSDGMLNHFNGHETFPQLNRPLSQPEQQVVTPQMNQSSYLFAAPQYQGHTTLPNNHDQAESGQTSFNSENPNSHQSVYSSPANPRSGSGHVQYQSPSTSGNQSLQTPASQAANLSNESTQQSQQFQQRHMPQVRSSHQLDPANSSYAPHINNFPQPFNHVQPDPALIQKRFYFDRPQGSFSPADKIGIESRGPSQYSSPEFGPSSSSHPHSGQSQLSHSSLHQLHEQQRQSQSVNTSYSSNGSQPKVNLHETPRTAADASNEEDANKAEALYSIVQSFRCVEQALQQPSTSADPSFNRPSDNMFSQDVSMNGQQRIYLAAVDPFLINYDASASGVDAYQMEVPDGIAESVQKTIYVMYSKTAPNSPDENIIFDVVDTVDELSFERAQTLIDCLGPSARSSLQNLARYFPNYIEVFRHVVAHYFKQQDGDEGDDVEPVERLDAEDDIDVDHPSYYKPEFDAWSEYITDITKAYFDNHVQRYSSYRMVASQHRFKNWTLMQIRSRKRVLPPTACMRGIPQLPLWLEFEFFTLHFSKQLKRILWLSRIKTVTRYVSLVEKYCQLRMNYHLAVSEMQKNMNDATCCLLNNFYSNIDVEATESKIVTILSSVVPRRITENVYPDMNLAMLNTMSINEAVESVLAAAINQAMMFTQPQQSYFENPPKMLVPGPGTYAGRPSTGGKRLYEDASNPDESSNAGDEITGYETTSSDYVTTTFAGPVDPGGAFGKTFENNNGQFSQLDEVHLKPSNDTFVAAVAEKDSVPNEAPRLEKTSKPKKSRESVAEPPQAETTTITSNCEMIAAKPSAAASVERVFAIKKAKKVSKTVPAIKSAFRPAVEARPDVRVGSANKLPSTSLAASHESSKTIAEMKNLKINRVRKTKTSPQIQKMHVPPTIEMKTPKPRQMEAVANTMKTTPKKINGSSFVPPLVLPIKRAPIVAGMESVKKAPHLLDKGTEWSAATGAPKSTKSGKDRSKKQLQKTGDKASEKPRDVQVGFDILTPMELSKSLSARKLNKSETCPNPKSELKSGPVHPFERNSTKHSAEKAVEGFKKPKLADSVSSGVKSASRSIVVFEKTTIPFNRSQMPSASAQKIQEDVEKCKKIKREVYPVAASAASSARGPNNSNAVFEKTIVPLHRLQLSSTSSQKMDEAADRCKKQKLADGASSEAKGARDTTKSILASEKTVIPFDRSQMPSTSAPKCQEVVQKSKKQKHNVSSEATDASASARNTIRSILASEKAVIPFDRPQIPSTSSQKSEEAADRCKKQKLADGVSSEAKGARDTSKSILASEKAVVPFDRPQLPSTSSQKSQVVSKESPQLSRRNCAVPQKPHNVAVDVEMTDASQMSSSSRSVQLTDTIRKTRKDVEKRCEERGKEAEIPPKSRKRASPTASSSAPSADKNPNVVDSDDEEFLQELRSRKDIKVLRRDDTAYDSTDEMVLKCQLLTMFSKPNQDVEMEDGEILDSDDDRPPASPVPAIEYPKLNPEVLKNVEMPKIIDPKNYIKIDDEDCDGGQPRVQSSQPASIKKESKAAYIPPRPTAQGTPVQKPDVSKPSEGPKVFKYSASEDVRQRPGGPPAFLSKLKLADVLQMSKTRSNVMIQFTSPDKEKKKGPDV